MTYSQRLSGGASLSEVFYLEQQIDHIKEEHVAAVEKLKQYEQVAENGQTKVSQRKIADVQMHVNMLSTRLKELENILDELVD